MKILHLIDSSGIYGAERMLLALMETHKAMGLEPILGSIGHSHEELKAIENKALDIGVKLKIFRFRAGPNLMGATEILRYARDERADLLHSHGYKANILLGLIPSNFRRVPLICTLHGWTATKTLTRISLYTWLECRLLKYLDAVVAVNSHILMDDRLVSAKIEKNRLHVIYNGIESCPSKYSSTLNQEIIRFIENGRKLVAIGRLASEKGFDCLIDAISLLKNHRNDIRLVIFGDGSLKIDLLERIRSKGLEESILLAGYHENARSYLPLFDMLVISSITEGLPINMLEAMAAEVSVVATSVGGIPEVITDHENGLLVPASDPESLSLAIEKLLSDKVLADRIKTRAAALVRKAFNSRHMAERYRVLYETVTGMERRI